MKLKINEKYEEVSIWSFVKFHFVASLIITGLVYASFFVIGVILTILGY